MDLQPNKEKTQQSVQPRALPNKNTNTAAVKMQGAASPLKALTPQTKGAVLPQQTQGAAQTQPKQVAQRGYYRGNKKAAAPKKPAIPVRIMPLGGLGEVGKNITLYECEDEMIMVDCGLVFPDSDMFGVDLVIPDFTYVLQNKERIHGIVITHGHEDHIGALPFLLKEYNFPIYATRLTIGLISNKLEEHGLKADAKLIEIRPKEKFKLGNFVIEPIHVNHSIPDAVALAISCPAGVILQTGDFKIDYTPISGGPTDLVTIGEYGKNGVLALLSDSTNAERPGFTATEQKVGESFERLFDTADKKRIIIATFASNLYRVQQIIDIAVRTQRKVAVSGRSMVNNTQMALELGYLHAPEGVLIDIEAIN
ncbi:MAG: ribonuclease J, partial [Oscillospiraceae bacterium]